MYFALYRKWRPKTFDEVLGQAYIVSTLKSQLSRDKVAHAYMFTGSRGTGKTSTAKLLAKAVNCLNPQNCNPCGVCEICKGIDDGSVLDVTEIDAASNNKVEDVREIIEQANYLPVMAKKRVYIIDEVHMLSTSAFNALLKIMEEPPEHVLFILATTEIHKVPATITSRCQRFDFRKVSAKIIAGLLQTIAAGEGFTVTEDAAALIASVSDGSFRDAISLLDLTASYDANITADTVKECVGLSGHEHIFAMAEKLLASDLAGTLALIDQAYVNYSDIQKLCEDLIEHFRCLLLMKYGLGISEYSRYLPDETTLLQKQADSAEPDPILFCLTALGEGLTRMTRSASPKAELEISAARMCNHKYNEDYDSLLARLEKLEQRLSGAVISGTNPKAAVVQKGKPIPLASDDDYATNLEEPSPAPSVTAKPVQPPVSAEAEELFEQWEEVLALLLTQSPASGTALGGSRAYVKGNRILIDSPNDFFLEFMRKNNAARDSIKDAIFKVSGQRFSIGPYKKEDVPQDNGSKLDELLSEAAALGVKVGVKN